MNRGNPLSPDGLSRRQLLRRGAGLTGLVASSGGLGGVLAACGGDGGGGNATGEIERGGVLKAVVRAQPDTLDPAKTPLASAFQVFTNMNSGLVAVDEQGGFTPALATKWSTPDDRTWIFTLRDDAFFHNGDKVTPEDVKFSIDRILEPKTASPWAANLSSIEAVEVMSGGRVALHLKEPYAPLLTILGRNAQVLSRRAIESGNPAREPVGCGPFEFVEWVQGDHITMKRNRRYFEKGLPHLNQVVFRFVAPSPALVTALRSGEQNYLASLPEQQVNSLLRDSAFNATTSERSGFPRMLAFNTKRAPLDNKALRQAIAWAVDREAVHKVAYFSAGQVGSEEVGDKSKWYGAGDPYREGPDLDRAKQLLRESGVKTPLTIEYMATASDPSFGRLGEVVRDQLKPLGIDLEVQVLEASIWLERLLGKEFQMTGIFNETVSDPDQMYSLMVLSDANLNVFNYDNPDCDKAILAAREEMDEARRKELYVDVRKYVFDDVPLFYVHYDTPVYLTNRDVLGATATPTLELNLQTVGYSTSA